MDNSNLRSSNNTFVQLEPDLGHDIDSAALLIGHLNAKNGLVKVRIEFVAVLGYNARETVLLEDLEETRLGHDETVVHRLQLALELGWIGASGVFRRIGVGDGEIEHVGNLEEVFAEALNAVDLHVVDLFSHSSSSVFGFGHCSEEFVFRLG